MTDSIRVCCVVAYVVTGWVVLVELRSCSEVRRLQANRVQMESELGPTKSALTAAQEALFLKEQELAKLQVKNWGFPFSVIALFC